MYISVERKEVLGSPLVSVSLRYKLAYSSGREKWRAVTAKEVEKALHGHRL